MTEVDQGWKNYYKKASVKHWLYGYLIAAL
jgi:hypothetical protein